LTISNLELIINVVVLTRTIIIVGHCTKVWHISNANF